MPAIPELGQVGFGIGRGEIFGKLDADQSCRPNGNIRVAAEIKIDLEGVGIQDDPHPAARADLGRQGVVQSDQCQGIRDRQIS